MCREALKNCEALKMKGVDAEIKVAISLGLIGPNVSPPGTVKHM